MQNFMAIFTVPSRNSHLQANDELYPIYFFKKKGQNQMSKKKSNPLFYGRNFTEMKIPGSKIGFIVTNSRKKRIFDPIFFDIFCIILNKKNP